MTIILIAVAVFVVGLGMIVMFRSAVSADDELERRLADALKRRAELAAAPGAPDDPGDPDEPPGAGGLTAPGLEPAGETPPATDDPHADAGDERA